MHGNEGVMLYLIIMVQSQYVISPIKGELNGRGQLGWGVRGRVAVCVGHRRIPPPSSYAAALYA